METSTRDPIFVIKSSIINGVDRHDNKVSRIKPKNMVIPDFLVKSKLLIKLSFGAGFLTFRARLTFVNLRQVFIKTSIFYYFDSEYHICVKIDISDYVINSVVNQLTLDNSSQ